MAPSMSLFSINAILILSTEDGTRILAKYYNPPHSAALPGHSSGKPLLSTTREYSYRTHLLMMCLRRLIN
jgi:hypothetical protein